MGKIYYTIDEANKLLPNVERKIKKLIEMNDEINLMNAVKVNYQEDDIENNLIILDLTKKYHLLQHKFYSEVEKLTKLGVIIKDLEKGLIDFYSKLEEDDIFLCWKLGEEKIAHWHHIEDGVRGRKSIKILEKVYQEKLQQLI